jgi:dihydroorotate dehydrogenase
LIISAPFGNYIGPGRGSIRTLGTFTLNQRGGWLWRIWRVLKTVRYSPRRKAWVNKLGLPNPGIGWLINQVRLGKLDVSDKIISVKGFNATEWFNLVMYCWGLKPLAVELNLSCPNVNAPNDSFKELAYVLQKLQAWAEPDSAPLIVKLPPDDYQGLAYCAWDGGVRIFHCCNTLPCPRGGLSGAPLKGTSMNVVRDIREKYPKSVIIGGGGIITLEDAKDFAAAGADSYAMASALFFPSGHREARRIARAMSGLREVVAYIEEVCEVE